MAAFQIPSSKNALMFPPFVALPLIALFDIINDGPCNRLICFRCDGSRCSQEGYWHRNKMKNRDRVLLNSEFKSLLPAVQPDSRAVQLRSFKCPDYI